MSGTLKRLFTLQRLRLLFIYVVIFIVSGFIGNIWMTRHQQTGLAPAFSAKDLSGNEVNLASGQTDDKPRLLYFFADWCPICKVQHPVISSIHDDFEVTGIAMQSGDSDNVRKYVSKQNIEFQVVNDETGNISQLFGVNGVPAAFVIDKMGQIKYSTRGYATEAGLRSRLWLAERE